MPETIKYLGSTTIKIAKNENDENVPYLEITEAVLVYSSIVNSDYQHESGVLYTSFAPNKSFGQLLDILTKIFLFL